MRWRALKAGLTGDELGFIPDFLSETDKRNAAAQINAAYVGGWQPIQGFTMGGVIRYPGDPPLEPLFEAKLRDETIRFYRYAFLSIQQPDGSFEVARLD